MKKEGTKAKRMLALSLATVTLGVLIAINALVLPGCSSTKITNETETRTDKPAGNPNLVTVYKPSGCDCCSEHIAYLEDQGYEVEVHIIDADEQASLRKQYPLPTDMRSCHISVVQGYFVEGHMPVEAIEQLKEEKPDIDGIFLPGMPAGSPGMEGEQTEPFIIYAFSDGEISEYMTIGE